MLSIDVMLGEMIKKGNLIYLQEKHLLYLEESNVL